MDLFKQLRSYFISYTGGSKECHNLFLGRKSAVTSSVEGFYTADGIQIEHMFLWRAKSPKDAVKMGNYLPVRWAPLHLLKSPKSGEYRRRIKMISLYDRVGSQTSVTDRTRQQR